MDTSVGVNGEYMKREKSNIVNNGYVKICPKCQEIILYSKEFTHYAHKKYVKCPHCNTIFEMKYPHEKNAKFFNIFYFLIILILIILRITRVLPHPLFLKGIAIDAVAFLIDLFFQRSNGDLSKMKLEMANMEDYMNLKDPEKFTFYPESTKKEKTNEQ